jgi:serine/threonine-protein kinase RsbW
MTLQLVLRNTLPEVERMTEALLVWGRGAGLSETFLGDLRLVLEELMENAIRHGYPAGVEGRIDVRIALKAAEVEVEVEDDGGAFDLLAAPPPDLTNPVEDRPAGGLGIFLVRKLTNSLTYRRTSRTNLVRFSIRMPSSLTASGTVDGHDSHLAVRKRRRKCRSR